MEELIQPIKTADGLVHLTLSVNAFNDLLYAYNKHVKQLEYARQCMHNKKIRDSPPKDGDDGKETKSKTRRTKVSLNFKEIKEINEIKDVLDKQ